MGRTDQTTDPLLRRIRHFVIGWSLVCIAFGALAGWQVLQLSDGADAIDRAGRGIERTAGTLDQLSDLPFVGDGAGDAAKRIATGGRATQASADDVRAGIVRVAIIVALATALLPTIPLVATWWLVDAVTRTRIRAAEPT